MDYRSLSSKTPLITMFWQFDTERLNLTFLCSDQIQRSRPFYPIICLIIPKKKNCYLCSCFHGIRNYTDLQAAYRNPFKNENTSWNYYFNSGSFFPCCSQCYFSPPVNEGSRPMYSTPPPFHQLDTYVFKTTF